jgi:hypothetical protein
MWRLRQTDAADNGEVSTHLRLNSRAERRDCGRLGLAFHLSRVRSSDVVRRRCAKTAPDLAGRKERHNQDGQPTKTKDYYLEPTRKKTGMRASQENDHDEGNTGYQNQ